jgi:hypothetical protein
MSLELLEWRSLIWIAAARLPSSSPRISHSRWIVASISEKSPDGALLLLPIEAADFSQSPGWGPAITAVRFLFVSIGSRSARGFSGFRALRVQARSPFSPPICRSLQHATAFSLFDEDVWRPHAWVAERRIVFLEIRIPRVTQRLGWVAAGLAQPVAIEVAWDN